MSKTQNVPIFSLDVGWLIWKENLQTDVDLDLFALPSYCCKFL